MTVYFGHPLFLMSGGYNLWRPDQIMEFRGYLSKFEFAEASEGPETTLTVTYDAP